MREPVRLPIVGARPRASEEIPPLDDALRIPLGPRSVVVVGAQTDALARALTALRDAARSVAIEEQHALVGERALTREASRGVHEIDGPLESIPAALARAMAVIDRGALVLGTGPVLVRLGRARVAVLVTAGLPPSEWGRDVRSIRAELDLIVPELDPALARALVQRIARHSET